MRKAILIFLLGPAAFAQLPSRQMTPGVIRTSNASEICAPTFRTKPFRHTTAAMKKQVCQAYGVKPCPKAGALEIDHLIPLELGGMDDVRNLWPQMAKYADGSPGFHVKDHLENELRARVCAEKMALSEAQACISSNWIACYQRVVGPIPQP